jgi:outer membrane protein assembly factor BamB
MALPALGVILVVAGCGGHRHATLPPPPPSKPRQSPPSLSPPRLVGRHRALLVVTVIDGDQWLRVPRARVSLWGRTVHTNRKGIAEIRVPWRRGLDVTVQSSGFTARTVYERFDRFRKVTVPIYRPELQWPLYGATDARTQAQNYIRLRPPFRSVWAVPMGGLIEFPAVVDQGVAYIGNANATVRAISMVTGKVLWRHNTAGDQMASSAAVVGSELVYHTMDGHVFVLDAASGQLRWRYDVGSPVESSPIVRRGVDYFGAWNGRLYALDLRTRRLRWTRELGAKITSSAAIANEKLYIGDYAGKLWALSAQSGRTYWVQSVNGRIYGTPAVVGGRVFVPSSTGDSLTAFTTGGRYLWRIDTGSYVYSSPAAWAGRVFFGSYNGVFYGASAATGRILWRVGTGGPISGAASVVAGIAYAGSFADQIIGVDTLSGRVALKFPHGEYAPVSGDGMQLLFHGYSTLYAVQPELPKH